MNRVEIPLLSSLEDNVAIRKAIVSGYFFNAARIQMTGEAYRSLKHGQSVHIHPSSSLFGLNPRWVLYHELVLTAKEYIRQVIEIQPEWLLETAPHYFKPSDIEDKLSARKMPKTLGRSALS
jgi:pre-mRNA-splicing factor ATP-dependent RNA helicase DHX16